MSKKVLKIGSSLGVTLSKGVLEKLGLKLGDEVDINFNPRKETIEISKAYKPLASSSSSSVAEKILDKYSDELKKLDQEW